tara:strand:- start:33 stop:893 length:861 start_codon:yes stop_codon:yes gene_type:complete
MEYKGRGIHKEIFKLSLKSGYLMKLLKLVQQDEELDIQIRQDYLNIYYEGGNLGKLKGEKSIEFDIDYFSSEDDEAKNKHKDLIKKFKKGDFKGYINEAKKVMKAKFDTNPKEERKDQHFLSLNNKFNGGSDYTILDLEYQVSTKSDFSCSYPAGGESFKKPRFDIIAVNKDGKLCIIELKKGTGALESTSGLKEHYDCYLASVGRNPKPFLNEMKNLLDQKKELGLMDFECEIKHEEIEFMFAYAFDKSDKQTQKNKFLDVYSTIGVDLKILWIEENEKFMLLDK